MWTAVANELPPWQQVVVVVTEGGQAVMAAYGNPTGEGPSWYALREGEHPECWTSGICWKDENEDGEPSDPPKWWAPQPSPKKE